MSDLIEVINVTPGEALKAISDADVIFRLISRQVKGSPIASEWQPFVEEWAKYRDEHQSFRSRLQGSRVASEVLRFRDRAADFKSRLAKWQAETEAKRGPERIVDDSKGSGWHLPDFHLPDLPSLPELPSFGKVVVVLGGLIVGGIVLKKLLDREKTPKPLFGGGFHGRQTLTLD